MHDREILSKGDMKPVKGGSWFYGLAYLQFASNESFDKDKKSSCIGFGVAVSHSTSYEKYFPKKPWRPRSTQNQKKA